MIIVFSPTNWKMWLLSIKWNWFVLEAMNLTLLKSGFGIYSITKQTVVAQNLFGCSEMVIVNESALVIKGKEVVNNPAVVTFIQANGKVTVIINDIVPFTFGALRKALVSSDYIGFVTNLVSNSEL
jgi:hypothetical protein